MKTYSAKADDIDRKWYLIDAEGKILGRLATQIAKILRGKNKPTYTPSMDLGDYVVVVNAEKIKVTGNKLQGKIYRYHTFYPGGLKSVRLETLLKRKPELVVKKAIQGMIPHNKLGRAMIKKLKIYKGSEHPHQAQKLEKIN
ncbi:MAG: 50S ribosomal protein L13 [bacterium]|uniref:Large ribosomal subunit protein uL13 n=1 Tax=Candidatus Infernicultor aquiphilus TaxID=1805029 RepID=A0A1J5GEK2_9BACT|nr:50S ribosomal protein L13 [bacterium]OIP70691.1 MAG: 50S ribosomal protein L13 [Candidatus Atribacteria bacterium CG2_30_33_13]PIX35057.1 MAG: 50S ribosomal protein L13 [Candidatus Atribacteria bacterium CG_4_8_14_3_um_filter_34_18]PJB58030.1 MAG: 50S ribosomal protein L13 [Candidatus Atribacteria bacterium CG_4_9_14_3_um_filter_33_16]